MPESNEISRAHYLVGLKKQDHKEAERIEKECNLNLISARILAARGYKAGEVMTNFINPTLSQSLPHPEELVNLVPACSLIKEIVEQDGAIAICCDFDVDGLTGGSLLQRFFRSIGVKSRVFVPDRFSDGYGLNEGMVSEIAKLGFKALIAVDYGTSNLAELELASRLGLKTIVVDHHHVGEEPPPADVFINPNQEGCNFADNILCAAGLAWYLTIGLRKAIPKAEDFNAKEQLDLVCLGTICDMVPLVGANRLIAKYGLKLLGKTKKEGLIALKNVIGLHKEVSCYNIGFGIGPRINAAGRMVNGDVVVELLTTSDTDKASKIASRLNKLNIRRQETEKQITEEAIRQVHLQGKLPWGIVAWGDNFHTGVIGIVAQRLSEMFYRPSIVIGLDHGVYKGSARGIKDFNVVDALSSLSPSFSKFGGHKGAGGFSLKEKDPESFAKAFDSECEKRLKKIQTEPTAMADTEVKLSDIDYMLIEELNNFAPFGIGNPTPQLLVKDLKVTKLTVMKNAHMKMTFSGDNTHLTAVMWRQNRHPALKNGNRVNIVCKPGLNTYNGRTEIQLSLQAVEAV